MKVIIEINLHFKDESLIYEVGKNGITSIKEASKNGEMASIIYYEIYKHKKHYVDLHQFTEVFYDIKD